MNNNTVCSVSSLETLAFVLAACLVVPSLAAPAGATPQCDGVVVSPGKRKAKSEPEIDSGPISGHPKLKSGRIHGTLVKFTHKVTSKKILEIEWQHVGTGDEAAAVPKGLKGAKKVKKVLPRTEALALLNGEDNRRPLLVVRECAACRSSDRALLNMQRNNDRIRFLCRWFRCVKLPIRVVEGTHPLSSLFDAAKPAHLFLCHWNGEDRVEFDGMQTQGKLQQAMVKLIERAYDRKPRKAVSAMLRLLAQLDKYDEKLKVLQIQIQQESLSSAPSRRTLAGLEKKITATEKQRDQALKEADTICDLGLRPLLKKRLP